DRARQSRWRTPTRGRRSLAPQRIFDLLARGVGALQTKHAAAVLVEQVAAAEELGGVAFADDDVGVGFRGDAQGDAAGKVAAEEWGDDGGFWALGGEDQMDAGGAGFGAQAFERSNSMVIHLPPTSRGLCRARGCRFGHGRIAVLVSQLADNF